jgi:hypothetical protein
MKSIMMRRKKMNKEAERIKCNELHKQYYHARKKRRMQKANEYIKILREMLEGVDLTPYLPVPKQNIGLRHE